MYIKILKKYKHIERTTDCKKLPDYILLLEHCQKYANCGVINNLDLKIRGLPLMLSR